MAANKLDELPNVEIDNGRFKYILIKAYDPQSPNNEKHIVRGFKWASYHADIYDFVSQTVEILGLKSECVGGGRIRHNPDERKIQVFGYSTGYGKADHNLAVEILKGKYRSYDPSKITVTEEDY